MTSLKNAVFNHYIFKIFNENFQDLKSSSETDFNFMYIATPPTQLDLLQEVRLMVRKEIPDFEILFQDTLGQFLHEKLKLSDCGDEKIEGLSFEILSLAEMEICYQVSLIALLFKRYQFKNLK